MRTSTRGRRESRPRNLPGPPVASTRFSAREDVAGLTLVEVTVALTILVIIIGALMTIINAAALENRTDHEEVLALDAGQSLVSRLQSRPFAEVFAAFNQNPSDDPEGAGTAPGPFFAVRGLNVRLDDPDGFVGRIAFPVVGNALREDVVDPALGLPRDLNGDGAIDAADHAADYSVLPVRITIEWTGPRGLRTLELVTILAAR